MEDLIIIWLVFYVFWKIVKVVIVAMTTPDHHTTGNKKNRGIRLLI